MTFGEVYRAGRKRLAAAGIESPEFDASCLFQKAFGSGRQERILRSAQSADGGRSEAFDSMVRQRAEGRPLQYILGEWPFFGMNLEVGEGVLIPREETELLVRVATKKLGGAPQPEILDLCSGTGAVALALASLFPQARIWAAELNGEALAYLHKNIQKTGYPVTPLQIDVLSPASAEAFHDLDCIASNPPYVRSEELSELQREVRREPDAALDGGPDGLKFYRAIAEIWVPVLKPGGVLAVEVGEGQAPAVRKMFEAAGLEEIGTEKDFNGIERVVSGSVASYCFSL